VPLASPTPEDSPYRNQEVQNRDENAETNKNSYRNGLPFSEFPESLPSDPGPNEVTPTRMAASKESESGMSIGKNITAKREPTSEKSGFRNLGY
jgi:hypothetical protein